MPLYEDKHNAENLVKVSEKAICDSWFGNEKVLSRIVNEITAGKRKVALEGWYGVNFAAIVTLLDAKLKLAGINAKLINACETYKPLEELKEYKKPYVSEDPGFGFVNDIGVIEDLLDLSKVSAVKAILNEEKNDATIVFGYGSASLFLKDSLDLIVYFDNTMQAMQWQMWDGSLIPFGLNAPDDTYNWKEFNYCDFYLLFRQKKCMYNCMDFYVEATEFENMKMVSKASYDEIISKMVTQPIKQVQIFQPGPWGAYRFKDLWDIPGLSCSAWNKMSGPEMSVVIDFGGDGMLNVPLINLLQYNEQVTGAKVSSKYPDLFPLDIWLDDGYFDKPQPAERISMPIHNHPDSNYVSRHFNEPLGRYETYYIAEAYEGANTWMGYYDDCDMEEWENKCRESNNIEPIENWKEYICNWKSNVGDLYLIPPGTVHGHGGNQMVLEMDTAPSIAGTEYSFFQYDFARNSWDDDAKTMTGKPLKMHLEHGFDNERYRKETYVKDKLRARPEIISWNKEFYMDRFSSLPEMPFNVERIFFDKRAQYTTDDRFLQILTLTVGHNATIRSLANPDLSAQIERLQCIAIPACFGDYEIISDDGSFCTIVCFYLKDS